MSWLLVVHAFNPLLLFVGMNDGRSREADEKAPSLEAAFASVLTSLFAYLFWLGGHFLVLKIAGADFDYAAFIGEGASAAYFLPFVIGGVMLVLGHAVKPRLRGDKSLAFADTFNGLLLFAGGYFMLINYLAWLAK